MNIYHIGNKILRFKIWNLNYQEIDGHWTIWLDFKTGKFLIGQHGDFGNLVSYIPVSSTPREPTDKEFEVLKPLVDKEVSRASFYVRGLSWTKRPFLSKELNQKARVEYLGRNGNTVFKVDYYLESEETKKNDKIAVDFFSKNT